MTATRVFVSYDAQSQTEFSNELALALVREGFVVWQNHRIRRNLRLLIQSLWNKSGELGLDNWLRKGILKSDVVVTLIPYNRRPSWVPKGWELAPIETAEELLDIIVSESNELSSSYKGEASSRWSDPRHLDQAAYYLFRPVQTIRMVWYEKHGFPPLGKDPFEHWRRWEMRVAGAVHLPVVLVILIEPPEMQFVEFINQKLSSFSNPQYIVVRRSSLECDVRDRLVTAIRNAPQSWGKSSEIAERKRKLWRLRVLGRAKILLWSVVGIVVLGVLFTTIAIAIKFVVLRILRWIH